MKTYTIKTPYVTAIRKRRDSASALYIKEVYAALAANGQLDTTAGHKLYAACLADAKSVASGAYSLFDISHPLPHNAGYVTFECT